MSVAPSCGRCGSPAFTTVLADGLAYPIPVCKKHRDKLLTLGYRQGPELTAKELGADGTPWERAAWTKLLELASSGRKFTAEDLRAEAGDPPIDNMIGALFGTASRSGLIADIGTVTPVRTERHGNKLTLWIGARPKGNRS